jgi:transposase
VPKKFPPEFKRDVVRVARRGDLSQAEVAADFDISVESVRRWVRQADIDDGVVEGQTSSEQSELVQLRREKRRLEMERVTGIEPAWPAWKAGPSEGVFAGQQPTKASDSVPVTHP